MYSLPGYIAHHGECVDSSSSTSVYFAQQQPKNLQYTAGVMSNKQECGGFFPPLERMIGMILYLGDTGVFPGGAFYLHLLTIVIGNIWVPSQLSEQEIVKRGITWIGIIYSFETSTLELDDSIPRCMCHAISRRMAAISSASGMLYLFGIIVRHVHKPGPNAIVLPLVAHPLKVLFIHPLT
jgi:hypothetical protein